MDERARSHLEAPALTPLESDADLPLQIDRALRATGYGPLRNLGITCRAGILHLGGKVPSYHLEQVALATAMSLAGPHAIQNDLEIVRPG
ncbi:MAG: BON domain-containing protein [Gemmataceae bacterium]